MAWTKKSNRRKSLYEKEQEVVEHITIAEENGEEANTEEAASLEPEVKEEVLLVKQEEPMEEVPLVKLEEPVEEIPLVKLEEPVEEVPTAEAEKTTEEENNSNTETSESTAETEEDEFGGRGIDSLECFVEPQTEKKNVKKYILTVVAVVTAIVAVIGVITTLCSKKKA